MPDNVIGTFFWFVSDIVGRTKNTTRQTQIIMGINIDDID